MISLTKFSWTFLILVCSVATVNAEPTLREPTSNRIVKITKTLRVKGVLDCKGATYRWTGSGSCGQAETMPPIFKLSAGATLKNCHVENAPDGIHIEGSNVTISNVVMPDVCEDAVSIKKNANYTNIKISNSQFANCADKCLQFNPKAVKKLTLLENDFFDGSSCVRFKGGADVIASGNEFVNCKRAFFHSEGAAKLQLDKNRYYNVSKKLQASGDLKVSGKD